MIYRTTQDLARDRVSLKRSLRLIGPTCGLCGLWENDSSMQALYDLLIEACPSAVIPPNVLAAVQSGQAINL